MFFLTLTIPITIGTKARVITNTFVKGRQK